MNEQPNIPIYHLKSFKFLSLLGRGAKGVVFRVRSPDSDQDFALKIVLKESLKTKNKTKSSVERDILRNLRHPLLPTLRGVLETENVVGYAIDYCPGKDLNSVRRRHSEKMFSNNSIRFYGAELVLALEYLHNCGIVYRDLKPENVMIQENGHLMLVDFDLSTKLSQPVQSKPESKPDPLKKPAGTNSVHPAESDSGEKSNSFVGTEDYVAPEVVLGKGHDYAVDIWCLGVVMYEMLYGTTPFRGANRKETFSKIVNKRPDLVGEATALRDLIGKLLEKDPRKRIGVEEIKGHNFFRGVDWEMVWRIQRPPYIPAVEEDEVEEMEVVDVEGIFGGEGERGVWVGGLDQPFGSDKFMVY